jgi:WD40 repeat protein
MPNMTAYDAFISYSHRASGRLGPALRDALHDFGRPWYRLRNMRVFCDKSSVTPNESLWGAIATALQVSATFILLASTVSARSPWVQREVRTWQAQRPRRPLVIVVTDGEVVWDNDVGDFDWQRTTALPESLRGWFRDEPLWVDLRPVVAAGRTYTTSDPLFLDAVATIAAAVQGRPKDELIGDDIRKFRGARRFRRLSVTGLCLLTVAALVAAMIAGLQRAEAQTQARVALGGKLVAQAELTRADDPRSSLEYGLAAIATDATPAARGAVQHTLTQSRYAGSITDHNSGVGRVLYTVDGHTMISSDDDGRVLFTDAVRRVPIGKLPPQEVRVTGIALDATGRLLVTSGATGSTVWDVADLQHPRRLATMPLPSKAPQVFSRIEIAFRPHSAELAVADGITSVSLWSLATPTRPARVATIDAVDPEAPDIKDRITDVLGMAFTPDGSTLALAGENDTATFWSMTRTGATYAGRLNYDGDYSALSAIGISPQGHLVAVAAGSTVGLFDITDLRRPRLVGRLAHVGRVQAIAISPDGRSLVTGGLDDTATLWDISKPFAPVQVAALRGHTDIIDAVAFSPDGLQMATGSDDHTVMVWHRHSAGDPPVAGTFRTGQPVSNAAALRPDGRVLAVAGGDNSLELWAVDDPSAPRRLSRVFGPLMPDTTEASTARLGISGLEDIAFAPDGRTIVVGGVGTPKGQDGLVSLYDVTDPTAPRRLATMGDYQEILERVALSPDGIHLATGGGTPITRSSAFVVLWNIIDPAHPVEESRFDLPLRSVSTLRFDGTILNAVGFSDEAGTAAASWDIHDPTHPVQQAAFGNDRTAARTLATSGRHWLVTGGTEKDLAVWDTADHTYPRAVAKLDGHRGGVTTVALNASAQMLATSGVDKTIRIWDVSAPANPTLINAIPWNGDQPVTALFDPLRPLLWALDRGGTIRMWNTTEIAAVIGDPVGLACATLTPGPLAAEWSGKLDPQFSGQPC